MIGGAVALVVVTVPVFMGLGSEFMPPLDEGDLLFMPTTVPGISVREAQKLLQTQDRILAQFPEVERVLGKAGRAESATDPAPLSMMETVIQLKPRSQWRHKDVFYDNWPNWMKPLCRRIKADTISTDELVSEMDNSLHLPGVSNAWTMPIKNRIEMLTTGMRTKRYHDCGKQASSKGSRGTSRHATRPARALVIRIGTEKVWSLP